ncbi:MAG: hypothetical protein HZC38_16575 [Chloroflexi bacterium]|nr:hypothetical protein [Chloroflexota bacterium]MBI5079699.1 hypothetical protein [Chloroflexota bacterium]MBI5715015.1 hypothetical protein [Chloroflexota bacterium]
MKAKRVKESRAVYRAKRKPSSPRVSKANISLRWAELESATAPIILEKDGKPTAVVIRYEEYERSTLSQVERKQVAWREMEKLLAQVHAHTQKFSDDEIEADITMARGEVREAHRLRRIKGDPKL